jgi:hypothetical protein
MAGSPSWRSRSSLPAPWSPTISLVAYYAEHHTNPEFATVGDASVVGIATLTTARPDLTSEERASGSGEDAGGALT